MNPWLLGYDGSDPAREESIEALTTLGNGYLSTRGAAPESHADGVHRPATYVADHRQLPVSRFTDREEVAVNAPDWLPLTFRAGGGDWFAPGHAEILAHRRTLDMRRGTLGRSLRVRDSQGRITRLEQHRLVSMDDPHLAALTMTAVPENWNGLLEIRSALGGRVTDTGTAPRREPDDLRLVPICGHATHGVIELLTRTATSSLEIALAARTTPAGGRCRTSVEEGWVSAEAGIEVRAGEEVTVEKIVALYTSRDRSVTESEAAARSAVVRAGGFPALLGRHVKAWDRLWRRAHVTAGNAEAQQILNLYLFHLLQTTSPRLPLPGTGLPPFLTEALEDAAKDLGKDGTAEEIRREALAGVARLFEART